MERALRRPHLRSELGERTIARLLVTLVLAYTAFAMVQSLIGFSMNRIIGAAIIVVLTVDFICHLTRLRIVAMCMVATVAVFGIGIFTINRSQEYEFYIYWCCTLLFLSYASRLQSIAYLREALRRYRLLSSACLFGCTGLAFLLLLSHTGYVTSWGGDSYFVGFANAEHTMASIACLLMALAYVGCKEGYFEKLPVVAVFLIFSFALLETGARAFLVPAAIIWILFVSDESLVPQRWIRYLVAALFAMGAFWMFMTSSMVEKFNYLDALSTSSNTGAMDVLTSGRLDYWRTDLTGFLSGDLFHLLFGNSASFVFNFNMETFHMPIWAHSDFVMVLCSAGCIGFTVYIAALHGFFRSVRLWISKWQFRLVAFYILFPAFINGFYGYQHFVYSAILLVCSVVVPMHMEDGEKLER